ncbi:MAG: rod shape-determining protein MreC [Burkholderiales bacterium]|nr:rod shape-determining protein MreC [Burkholderiales bacterium]
MYQEPFFTRGPSPLARLTFFALIAIVVMIADHRFRALDAVRMTVSAVLHPIERAIAMPGEMAGRVADYFTSQDKLLADNRALELKVLELSAASQQAKLLKSEHERLIRLAQANDRLAAAGAPAGVIAEIIRDARNPFNRRIIIDKGMAQGLRAGLPVIDGSGVVGQVTALGTLTSEVTLITEKDQSVPVMLVRNGLRAVSVGMGKEGTIDVPFIPASADIQNGDLFVTSGIDGLYPPGLAVATITSVEKNAAFPFARITGTPASGADSHRFVMVLNNPTAANYPVPDVANEERKAGRDRGTRSPRREAQSPAAPAKAER